MKTKPKAYIKPSENKFACGCGYVKIHAYNIPIIIGCPCCGKRYITPDIIILEETKEGCDEN